MIAPRQLGGRTRPPGRERRTPRVASDAHRVLPAHRLLTMLAEPDVKPRFQMRNMMTPGPSKTKTLSILASLAVACGGNVTSGVSTSEAKNTWVPTERVDAGSVEDSGNDPDGGATSV